MDVVVIVETGEVEVVETDIRSPHSTRCRSHSHCENTKNINTFASYPTFVVPGDQYSTFQIQSCLHTNRTTYIRRYSHYHDTPPFMHTFLAAIIFTFPMSMRLVISSGERPIRPARRRQGGTARIDFGEHPGLAGDEFLYSWYVDRGNLV